MKKVVDYKILFDDSVTELGFKVMEHIKLGYEILGSPFSDGDEYLYQAVIKYQYLTVDGWLTEDEMEEKYFGKTKELFENKKYLEEDN